MGDPSRCGQHLDFDLLGPIGLVCPFQRGAKVLELVDLTVGGGKVAAAG